LLVVVDHERWFDRQTISDLRAASVRFGQERFVLFNRTREGDLPQEDQATLRGQAERLAAQQMQVLSFRHGRGFCQFVPGTLDTVTGFLNAPTPTREKDLLGQVGQTANQILNQNAERKAGLDKLEDSLHAAIDRVLPTTWDCMTAQMTAEERKQLEIVSRVFRLKETRHWLTAQTQRIQKALKGIPLVGMFVPSMKTSSEIAPDGSDRLALARGFYETVARRQVHEVQRVVRASEFWHEMSRWTGLTPEERSFQWSDSAERQLAQTVDGFEKALQTWTEKIESECRGLNPKVHGAVGAGAIALIVVLVAVPGPVTALTLVSAKGAIAAALTELLAVSGVGALFGSQMRQLVSVIQEKLIGSPEFEGVQSAATALKDVLEDAGRAWVEHAVAEADQFVMSAEEPLASALDTLRRESE
ncbi:MAG: hypothetical protein MI892_11685, partial [Desulfobacterales bacterium]|nr:hypothetical protein [Desulfobacterales bacterium]